MRILVTNDDGIHAPGLRALVEALRDVGEVTVVAPERERSAISHAITMTEPLRAWPVGGFDAPAWAVSGTPVDCVLLAVKELMPEPPDVVAAGINRGANIGEDVWYSGTVSAAREGGLLGYPALAFSVTGFTGLDFRAAAACARRLVPLAAERLPADTILNVNVPNLPPDRVGPIVLCTQGRRHYRSTFEQRQDPRGGTYYWLGAGQPIDEPIDGTDVAAIAAGRIAVTPICLDVGPHPRWDDLAAWLNGSL